MQKVTLLNPRVTESTEHTALAPQLTASARHCFGALIQSEIAKWSKAVKTVKLESLAR